MKQKILLVCMAVILVAVTMGCARSRNSELEGRWEEDQFGHMIYEFSGDRFTLSVSIPEIPELEFELSGTFSLSRDGDDIAMERISDDGERQVSIIRMLDENAFMVRAEDSPGVPEVRFIRVD